MAAAAARPPTMVIQDDYIDMDLSPTPTPQPPASPRFEFQSGGGASRRRGEEQEQAAFASPADELFYRGNLLPLHLPPRQQGGGVKRDAAAAGDGAAKAQAVGGKKPSWSKRLKVVRRWASRDYIRSLFLATARSGDVDGSASARAHATDRHDEVCHRRKSFSGIIRRVRLVAAAKAAPPGVSPLCSSSTPSCGNANGFFFPAAAPPAPALKRSSSAGSEEGAIQGAIAHCKRSQQQGVARRTSASDVVFYSVTNTPRASSVAAGEVRQEMCRG
jgi:hypothetical protein